MACPQCGRPTGGGGEGLCAACLLRLGLESEVPGAKASVSAASSSAPETVGPYRLERLLGEGGMGRVYLARQEEPVRRSVALKLIKHGVDSRETLARFDAERRSLELMDHPSIARVLDAGTTEDGRPYFVMEFVDGLPLTRYCDERKLSTEERLRLLVQVCDAVQHAHVKGVIHRDLKPSNVLVAETDAGPLPKVIDFGIAKATGERMLEWTHHTEMGRLIGTPEYMSPEQADTSRRDVDTRTDVYALGVLLYELLVGRTPHDAAAIRRAGLEEMLRRIRETDLPAPSSRLSTLGEEATEVATGRATDPGRLLRKVRGELDWITMRALERDRERRYGSSRELAEDLERYLSDEPVPARPPSPAYLVRKFVRRHRLGVGLAAAALLTLVVFAGTMAWQAGLIARERDRARIEAEASERVAGLMVDLFRSADPYGTAVEDPTARDVLRAGAARMARELADRPRLHARMLAEMGWALAGLGDYAQAEPLLVQAVELYRAELGAEAEPTLQAMSRLGQVQGRQERFEEAERLHHAVVRGFAARLGREHRTTLRRRQDLPELWLDTGRYEAAIAELEPLLDEQAAALGRDDPDTLRTGLMLGSALSHIGRRDEAQPYVDAALAGLRMPAGPYDEERAGALMRLGWLCLFLGRHDDAERVYGEVLERREEALGPDHARTLQTRAMVASIVDLQKRFDEAAVLFEELLEARRRVLGEHHPETLLTRSLLGDTLIGARRFDESAGQFRAAIEGYEASGQQGFFPARARSGLARALLGAGKPAEALPHQRAVQAYCDAEQSDRHPICRSNLEDTAAALRELGRDGEARELEERLATLEP